MQNLDSLIEISKLDAGQVLGSIEYLPEQIKEIATELKYLAFPKSFSNVNNIVVCGMGGSALGGRIVHSLFMESLKIPVEVVTSYRLPNYVNKDSLVFLSSYSGNTEETIMGAHDAISRKAQIVGIATGGKLVDILEKVNAPCLLIRPKSNPSGQPRMGLGYSIMAILGILSKSKLINLSESQIEGIIATTEKYVDLYGVRSEERKNVAKMLSKKILGKVVNLVVSEHLAGSAHAFKNQLNENAKVFSNLFEISELNHHLMEGLRFPNKNREISTFLFIESKNYFERIKKRYSLTEEVIKKNGFGYEVYKTQSTTKLEEVFEILVLGSYISFYLSMLEGINPSPIPWVDYFKEKLS